MTKLVNRAKMTTATTGTGVVTLGSAVDGYQTFSDAGVVNSDVVRYTIEDGDAWEIGSGAYSAGTLTRVLDESSTGSLLNLSGDAVVYVTAAGGDIQQPPSEGDFVDGDKTKLDGIEANADVTDTTNVTAAGALMDSELTDIASVKALDQGVATTDSPEFDVVTATSFVGDGSSLTGLPPGYTDADVDAHLNQSTATADQVLTWDGSDYAWEDGAVIASIAVTVAFTDSGNHYFLDGSEQQLALLTPSVTYRFDQSDPSNTGHPLRFSLTDNGTHNGGTEFTTGVATSGTPGSAGAYTEITLEQDGPQVLYYYCSFHSGMGGEVNQTASQTQLDTKVNLTSSTGSAILPAGTTAERDASPAAGYLRYNSDENSFEGYDGTEWVGIAADTISPATIGAATSAQGSLADSAVQPNDSPTFGTVNATTVDLGDWTVAENAGSLFFAYLGTNKMKLDSSGNLTVLGDVTAFGSL